MAEPSATPKQIAYLEFLGYQEASTYTKNQASELISDLHEKSEEGRLNEETESRMRDWGLDRFRLYPTLYRKEMVGHVRLHVDTFRNFVRSRVVGASEKLTKDKVENVFQSLFDEDLLWWDGQYAEERFFRQLSDAYPGCVDGSRPDTRRKTKTKPKKRKRQKSGRGFFSRMLIRGALAIAAFVVFVAVIAAITDDGSNPDKVAASPTLDRPKNPETPKKETIPATTTPMSSVLPPTESAPEETGQKQISQKLAVIPTDSRNWTSRDGRTLLGRVIEMDPKAETITIRNAEGEEFANFPISNLSDGDQIFLLGRKAKSAVELPEHR